MKITLRDLSMKNVEAFAIYVKEARTTDPNEFDGVRMAYISYIYILAPYRRQGIAHQLFSEAEKRMKEMGVDQYYLIQSDREEAKQFYDHFTGVKNYQNTILRKKL